MTFERALISKEGIPTLSRVGIGWLAMPKRSNQTTDSNQTIWYGAILGGLYTRSGTNTNRTDTTATAVDILAAMPDMDIGDTFMFMVGNLTANTLVIAGGVGVTASGNLSVLTLSTKWFMLEKTSATTMNMLGL